jgi:hypothetical protein
MSLLTNVYNLTYLEELYAEYLKDPSEHLLEYYSRFSRFRRAAH